MLVEERVKHAENLHNEGFNCAQSVAGAFSDLLSMDEDSLFRVMEGFGLGMGGMQGTCGAISGAIAVIGFLNSNGIEQKNSKAKTYQIVKRGTEEFVKKNQASVCKDLKGVETGKILRSCPGCIEDAVRITCEILGMETC